MQPDKVTMISWLAIWTILVALLAVAVVDLYLVRYGDGGPTASSTIWQIARQYPVIVLVVGVVLGHLLWPQH